MKKIALAAELPNTGLELARLFALGATGKMDVPPGTQVVLNDSHGKFTSGHLLLPDGSRTELSPEAYGDISEDEARRK